MDESNNRHRYPRRNIRHAGRRVGCAETGGRGKGGNLEWNNQESPDVMFD